jgi:hypothetical protein
MYIRIEHLQILHYFYFAAAIFNFSSLIITGIGTAFSYYFMAFCVIHMLFSWYITWIVRGNMYYYLRLHSLWFAGKHIVVTLLAVLLTVTTWLVTPYESRVIVWYSTPHGIELFSMIAYVNYLVFFMTVIWYLLFKFESISSTIRVYNSELLEKAKKAFIAVREKSRIRGLSTKEEVESYMYGSDSGADKNMIKLSESTSKENVIRNIRAIDIQIYRKTIESVKETLKRYKASGAPAGEVEKIEKIIREKEENLEKYLKDPNSIAIR